MILHVSRSRIVAVVVLVVAGVLGIATPLWAHSRHNPQAECPGFRVDARERAALVTGRGPETLVIGDSYAAGWKVTMAQSWPIRLPGRVRVDAFSGSGFSRAASPCGDVSYATRAAVSVRPGDRRVVVEGGLNDTDQPDAAIRAGFDRLMTVLHGHRVFVVGPPPAPLRLEGAVHVDALLARLCAAAGVDYISMIHADLPYLSDRLHLTPAGHREFGDDVARAVGPVGPVA